MPSNRSQAAAILHWGVPMESSGLAGMAAKPRRTRRDWIIDVSAAVILLGVSVDALLGTLQLAEEYRAKRAADSALVCATTLPACTAAADFSRRPAGAVADSAIHLRSKQAQIAAEAAGSMLILLVCLVARRWRPARPGSADRSLAWLPRRSRRAGSAVAEVSEQAAPGSASERLSVVIWADRRESRASTPSKAA